jgi:hypothetical protein
MKASFLIFASAILAGCSTIDDDTSGQRVVYVCNYGPDLAVTFGPYVAHIESDEGTVTLRQRPSTPGFWYESGTHSLRVYGDQITYRDRQMAPRQCRAI